MAVDISKIFKANVKAIRMGAGDHDNKETETLNDDLLGTNKSAKSKAKTATTTPDTTWIAKEARSIVSRLTLNTDRLEAL